MRNREGLLLLWVCLGVAALGCAHTSTVEVVVPFSDHVSGQGKGRPVILLPDLGMPPEVWDSTAKHLAENHEVHVIDVAGFAENPAVPGESPVLLNLRNGLSKLIRDQNLQGTVVIGMLFGATLGYWLAESEPALVSGLIAVDTPPSRYHGEVDPEVEEGRKHLEEATAEQFERMQQHRFSTLMNDGAQAKIYGAKAAQSSHRIIAEAFDDSMRRDLRPQARLIEAKVLVMLTAPEGVSKEDREAQEKAFRDELEQVPHFEVVTVPYSHHYLMFDQPALYFETIDTFIGSLKPAPSGR